MANINKEELANKAKVKADQTKRVATEAAEKMNSFDTDTKLKYGGGVVLFILAIVFIFSGSSYSDEFIESRISSPDNASLVDFNIVSENEIEFMGMKGTEMVLNVTFKSTSDKFICSFERDGDSYTFASDTEKGCFVSHNKKDWKGYHKSENHAVVSKPREEFRKVQTIQFDKTTVTKWEAKHS